MIAPLADCISYKDTQVQKNHNINELKFHNLLPTCILIDECVEFSNKIFWNTLSHHKSYTTNPNIEIFLMSYCTVYPLLFFLQLYNKSEIGRSKSTL